MDRGTIPINNEYELEYRYYPKDTNYKYFNRKFEIFLLEKKTLRKNYVLHMDNCDTAQGKWSPHVHRSSNADQKLYFGVSTLNWPEIRDNFAQCIIGELGNDYKKDIKKAVSKLMSPKL